MENTQNNSSLMKILYVDDNESFSLLVKRLLVEYECQLDFAENGAEAVEKFKTKEYELLFVDDLMPVMDGFTAVKEIRSFELEHRTTQSVIIMVSENDKAEDMEKCFDVGCDGYLIKPIKIGDLKEIFKLLSGDESKPEPAMVESESAVLEPEPVTPVNSEEKEEVENGIVVKVDKDLEGIVPEYLNNIRENFKKIPNALKQKNFELIYQIGHNMKGTGSSYGFVNISEIGKKLEKAGSDKNVAVITEGIAAMTEYLEKINVVYE